MQLEKGWLGKALPCVFKKKIGGRVVPGLHGHALAFSTRGKWGLLFITVCGLLIVVASLVAEHELLAHRLQQLKQAGSVLAARFCLVYLSKDLNEIRLSHVGIWGKGIPD